MNNNLTMDKQAADGQAVTQTKSRETAAAQAERQQPVTGQAESQQTVTGQTESRQTVTGQTESRQPVTGQTESQQTVTGQTESRQNVAVQTKSRQSAGSRFSTMSMVQVAIFGAVIFVMAFTPFLGYIPLGFTRATIIHIPVIIASLLMGPKKGGALGFLFGLTSFINNTMNPTPTSFVFTPFYSIAGVNGGIGSIIICFIPRILVGIIPYYVYKLILRFSKEETRKRGVSGVGLTIAGVAGALTNTLLVMNLIFVFFKKAYAAANDVAVSGVYTFILSIIGINGVPEAIVAGVLTLCIGRVLLKKNVRERLGFKNDLGY